MTAEPPGSPVTEGVRSLEVRWIFPGQLEPAVAGWFARFPAEMESREDTYLLDPQLPELSVKVRGGRALEVKAYRGSPGILEVAGRARGRMESWQKWSFPCGPPSGDSGDPAGWRPVHKRRRICQFSLASGQIVARAAGLGQRRAAACRSRRKPMRTRWKSFDTPYFLFRFSRTSGPAGASPSRRIAGHLAQARIPVGDPSSPTGPIHLGETAVKDRPRARLGAGREAPGVRPIELP